MEGLVQIKSVVKGPNTLKVGIQHGNTQQASGCKTISVTFADTGSVDIAAVTFTNKYCGILTVAAKYKIETEHSGESFKFAWKTLIKSKRLMPHFHYSTGGESNFIFRNKDFLQEAKVIASLKFVLQQPSVQFTEFSIENIKVFSEDIQENSAISLPDWLTRTNDSASAEIPHGFPVDEISQTLQKMWALTKKTHDMGLKDNTKPERFDKDGVYEINLLSYE